MRVLIGVAGIAVSAALAGSALLVAGPAMAQTSGDPLTVNATVNSAIILSALNTSTLTFPAGNPGDTVQPTEGTVTYTVTDENDTHGWINTWTPGDDRMRGAKGLGGSDAIPNSALAITCSSTPAGCNTSNQAFSGQTALVDENVSNPGTLPVTFNYRDDWTLAIPAAQIADSYSEGFTLTAVGQ